MRVEGWLTTVRSNNPQMGLGNDRKTDFHDRCPDPSSTDHARTFDRIPTTLTQNGVEVCLAVFPVTTEYAAGLSDADRYDQALKYFAESATNHEAKFLNFSSSITDHRLFLDQDHVNTEGTGKLGTMLPDQCFD